MDTCTLTQWVVSIGQVSIWVIFYMYWLSWMTHICNTFYNITITMIIFVTVLLEIIGIIQHINFTVNYLAI